MIGLRIGLIIPEDTPPTGGNRISASRLAESLTGRGFNASTWLYTAHLPSFDIYHAWNARRVGVRLIEEGMDPKTLVVTWTGTDLWQDWVNDYRPIKQALDPVRFQVVFTEDARRRLLEDAPDWADRVLVIPPSVNECLFRPAADAVSVPHPLILLAGGVRPVKRSHWAIDLVDRLRRETKRDVHLAIAGPIRHMGEWSVVKEKAATREWVHLVGEVPKEEMPGWYTAADLVLNTSSVEGVSNALMEAMSCGSLVLATDIQGNRALIEDKVTGLLFHDEEEFLEHAVYGLKGGPEVEKIRQRARHHILAHHALSKETDHYVTLYESSLELSEGGCCR